MKTHSGVIFTIIASTRWPGFSQPLVRLAFVQQFGKTLLAAFRFRFSDLFSSMVLLLKIKCAGILPSYRHPVKKKQVQVKLPRHSIAPFSRPEGVWKKGRTPGQIPYFFIFL